MDKNLTSPKAVRALLDEYAIAPLKKYGQNFLIDANIADKTASLIPEGSSVLEIGPGLGALTSRLLLKARAVAAYEIDSGLSKVLSDIFSGEKDLTVFHTDFLKAQVESDITPLLGEDIYVAANLPYYITSDCIIKLLNLKLRIKRMVFMVQKEFAERVTAPPGSESWGAINAALGFFTQPKSVFNVAPTCFYPAPSVSSSVLLFDMKEYERTEADRYLETVKALFSMRRKTIKSNIRHVFGLTSDKVDEIVKSAGLSPQMRAEQLDIEDIIKLRDLL